jgi:hypothetical protein
MLNNYQAIFYVVNMFIKIPYCHEDMRKAERTNHATPKNYKNLKAYLRVCIR